MDVRLVRHFGFEAAHRLPMVSASHKCSRLHGHSFRVAVTVRGPVAASSGWFIDYADIDHAIRPLRAVLDHTYLNDIPGLENPTSENIARYIWKQLVTDLPGLERVTVMESSESSCEYAGD